MNKDLNFVASLFKTITHYLPSSKFLTSTHTLPYPPHTHLKLGRVWTNDPNLKPFKNRPLFHLFSYLILNQWSWFSSTNLKFNFFWNIFICVQCTNCWFSPFICLKRWLLHPLSYKSFRNNFQLHFYNLHKSKQHYTGGCNSLGGHCSQPKFDGNHSKKSTFGLEMH